MIDASLETLIDDIESMDLDTLRSLWGARYGAPPTLRSVPILQMLLAWRIQAEALGGLDELTSRKLARKGQPDPEGRHLGIGARLARTWKGRRVEVIVEERGFRWEDRVYPSLSAAATAIAGSR